MIDPVYCASNRTKKINIYKINVSTITTIGTLELLFAWSAGGHLTGRSQVLCCHLGGNFEINTIILRWPESYFRKSRENNWYLKKQALQKLAFLFFRNIATDIGVLHAVRIPRTVRLQIWVSDVRPILYQSI